MRVRTRLQLGAVLPILLVIVMAVVLGRMASSVDNVARRMSTSDRLVGMATRIDRITYAYMSDPSAEMKTRWYKGYASMDKLLQDVSRSGDDLVDRVNQLRERAASLKPAFEAVVAAVAGGDQAQAQKRAAGLWRISQIVNSEARAISAESQAVAVGIQQTGYLLMVVLGTAMAALLALMSWLGSRRITCGISALSEGMERVAQGNVDVKIEEGEKDEIAGLIQGFNRMTQDLVQAQERLQKAQTNMIRNERLEALRQVSRGIVHDINDALMPILGLSEYYVMYPEKAKEDPDFAESIKAIYEAAKHAASVVRNLAGFFSSVHYDEARHVDMKEVMAHVVSVTEPLWREARHARGIHVDVKTVLADVPPMMANEADLREVLTAIMINAIDALPKGGVITCRVYSDGERVCVQITDDGVGMSTAQRERCFEPFFTTRPERTGMGLTATMAIVKRFSGTIDITTEIDKGTTVEISFPAAETIADVDPDDKTLSAAEIGSLKVLTIDDEQWVLKVLAQHLGTLGHAATGADCGGDGLAKFRSERFDLVIVDRAMDDMSGDQVALEVKKMSPKTPIIMLTGFGDMMLEGGETPEGVDVVIGKPMSHEELRVAIGTAVGQAPTAV